MLIAFPLAWDADNNRIGRAAVTADARIAIVCARTDRKGWEPLYVIDRDMKQSELPSCFSLSEKAHYALNALAEDAEAENEEYPPCPICGDPIDYCQGHGEKNAK